MVLSVGTTRDSNVFNTNCVERTRANCLQLAVRAEANQFQFAALRESTAFNLLNRRRYQHLGESAAQETLPFDRSEMRGQLYLAEILALLEHSVLKDFERVWKLNSLYTALCERALFQVAQFAFLSKVHCFQPSAQPKGVRLNVCDAVRNEDLSDAAFRERELSYESEPVRKVHSRQPFAQFEHAVVDEAHAAGDAYLLNGALLKNARVRSRVGRLEPKLFEVFI